MVALAQERLNGLTNVTIVKNDGQTLSQFADASCDFVYCVNVFQHIPDRGWIESYMGEIHRVLKAGGVAKVQVDGRGESRLWRSAAAIVGHDSWAGSLFTRRELVEMARKHGFVVVRCGYASDGGIRWPRQALWLHARRP
jgi:SAM-dependent methyltransferase